MFRQTIAITATDCSAASRNLMQLGSGLLNSLYRIYVEDALSNCRPQRDSAASKCLRLFVKSGN